MLIKDGARAHINRKTTEFCNKILILTKNPKSRI